MHTLPNCAWWILAAGLLLFSPVFAFFSALLVEVLIGTVKEGGVPALIIRTVAGFVGRSVLRRVRMHRPMDIVEDHA